MKKQLLTLKNLLLTAIFTWLILAAQSTQAQTVYFSENFDSAFTGSPAAPAGWTQTRIQAVTNTPSEFDWVQNVWLGSSWNIFGAGVSPTIGAVTGNGVLWINDANFGGTSLAQTERRIESPSFDLSTSTSPYVRFWYFNNEGIGVGLNLRVVISTNGGTTWQTLSNVMNGFDSLANTWNRISVPIPAKFRTTNVKIGFAIVNRWGSNNPFIDAVSVEEFTPTVITSTNPGNWNSPATWGGLVPTSSHHVVIAHAVTVGTGTGIVARCQDLTINSGATLNFGTTSSNSLHAYGNVTVNGTLSAFNGTLGRIVMVGGNFTIASGGVATFNTGTATQGTTAIPVVLTSTSSTLVLNNSSPASFTNAGTLSGGTNRINNVIHLGSDTFTYNNNVVVPFTFALRNGPVNPNGFLTIGNAPSTTTNNTIQRVNGFFTSAPNFNNTNITSRIMAYQFSNTVSVLPEQLTAGFEIEPIAGVRTVTGTLVMNTHDNVLVNYPLRVGTATTGAFTLTRGILITTDTIRLTSFLTPPAGTAPSTATPSTTHGSYVVGAMRIDMPTNTASRTFPLGRGTEFNQFTPNSNILRNRLISPGTSTWTAGTSITMNLLGGATGSVGSPALSLLGTNVTQISLNGGSDVPGTTTVTFNGINNYTFGGGTNSDNLFGNEDQLHVMQSANITGPWATASAISGVASTFINNTNYSRTTNPTISPIAVNGGFFTLGTQAAPVAYDLTTLNRNTGTLTAGIAQPNVQMMRVNVRTVGVVPGINTTSFIMNTAGTSNLSNIVNAKVYFTGADSNFSAINQFGTAFTAPSGRFIISGTRQLQAGNNFFWITYDIPGTTTLGDSLAVNCDTVIVAGTPYSITQPAPGFRIFSLPMTYVSSTSSHPFLNPIERNTNFHIIMLAEVVASPTGAPIPFNSLSLNTGSTSNPLTNIDSVIVWYTGSNSNFSTPVFFGGAGSVSGAFTVTGNQNLVNNSNFFWITYRLKPGANIGDSVDIDLNSINVNGISQVPSVTSPAGTRRIRGQYCVSGATSPGDEEIFNVSISTLNNSSNCTTVAPGPGSIAGRYGNYTTLPATNIVAGLTYPLNVTINSCGSFYGEKLNAYIDWNQDGDFNDTLETVMDIPYATGFANAVRSQNITVPCFALSGTTMMRVVYVEDFSAPSCGTYTWGETEDYTLNVISVPPTYTTSTTIQQTGSTSAAATNVPILRVPVKVLATACQPGQITQLNFNTAGTTSNADIVSAKLYKTGNSSVFSISNLLGTVTSPSGAFSFSITDTALNDSNNYWLTYDVSGTAPNANVLDARFDSAQVFGNWYVPAVSAPAGNIVIATPMTYISSTSSHPTLGKIERGTTGNQMMRIQVVMSSTGAPVALTQLNLSVNGSSSPLTNIDSIMVWYTGGNPNFISPSFYGGTGAQSGAYSISGLQSMLNDTNYFWVNYNVPVGATVGDSVDAEILTINVASTLQTPAVTAPAGSRQIRAPYCASSASSPAFDGEIWNVTVGTLNNSSTCTTTGGVGSIQGGYANYTTIVTPPNLVVGTQVPFSVHTSTCNGNYTGVLGIWIDFNDDGDFTDPGEEVHMSSTFTYGTTVFRTGNLTIPCASPGLKRMRVILEETTLTPISPCASYGFGETEDYTVNIVSLPPSYTSSTTLQQSGTTSASATNVPILRVPLRVFATSCQPGIINQLNFNTSGTTSVGDIVSAKLYKTGNNPVFGIANLVGTVTSPSGAFGFSITDTAVSDTNNYWLAYDVSGTAANGNVLDARFDSSQVFGNWYVPSVSNPVGNVLIATPMTYVGSTSIHPALGKIERGTNNNQMLRIQVVMSSTGSPLSLNQFNLSVAGSSSPLTNIDSISVWYTGANPNFVSPSFYGGTGAQSGAYSIAGVQSLLNDTNYFWVTYRVPVGALVGDSVDAEIQTLNVGGSLQTPSVTAPAGSRMIRSPYCQSNATNTGDEEIFNVSFASLNNSSNCTTLAPGPGSITQQYANYTTLPPTNVLAGITYPLNVTINTCGGFYGEKLNAYIDWNQDGDFSDTLETVMDIPFATGAANIIRSQNVTVPCFASAGVTRMRIVYVEGSSAPSCGTYTWGETEDYSINVVSSSPVYTTSTTIQQVGSTSASATNVPILRIPIKVLATACQPGQVTQLNFNTSGTTSVGDILAAKLYKTGNSPVFNITNLVGTVTSPSGAFSFSITDTTVNDTNNYWLSYDVSGSAANGNVLDARFDSSLVFGNWYVPSVSNPAGNVLISTPMTFVSATSSHPTLSRIERGTTNNQMLRIRVIMSSTGAPVSVSQLNLSVAGSVNPLTNIDSIAIWYTGANPNYVSPNFYGGTGAQSGAYSIPGVQTLLNDTNYFWVTYRVPSGATVGDSVDAEIQTINVGGTLQTPSVTAPAGARTIRGSYCPSVAVVPTSDGEIWNVTLGTLNNTSSCSTTGGPGSTLGGYSNYTTTVPAPQLLAGAYLPFSVHTSTCGGNYDGVLGIWVDFNEDGDFIDAGEEVHMTTPFLYGTTVFRTGDIVIPITVTPGLKRMRVALIETTVSPITACQSYFYGETEDYTIEILPAPVPTTYVWNQTAPAAFATATNWTPSRTSPNMNDRLVFNSGGTVSVNDLVNHSVKHITISNNTTVNMNTSVIANVNAWDTLALTSGRAITGSNVSMSLGSSNGIGTLTGSGSVQGILNRWIDLVNTTYTFPVSHNNISRNVSIQFSAPAVTGGTIGVTFIPSLPGTIGLPFNDGLINVNRVAENGYWNLSSGNGLNLGTTGNYNLALTANGFNGVVTLSTLTVARRATNTSPWDTAGTYAAATGTNAAPIANRSNLRVFGEFTLAGDSATNPLPVNLVDLKATAMQNDVLVTWITASELNNKGFFVEKSVNGTDFEGIGFVTGKGTTSSLVNYQLMDEKAFAVVNTVYYRLRQVDMDGTEHLSKVVSVTKNVLATSTVSIAPNPFSTVTRLNIVSAEQGEYTITITDIQGKTIATRSLNADKGLNSIDLIELQQVGAGVYFVRVAGADSVTLKVLKSTD